MSSRIGKNQSRTRIFPRRRRGQKRGVATAIGAILFFVIAFQIIAFIYEVNQVSTEMVDFDLQKSRESLEISRIGFNDYSPTSLQISSGQLTSGNVDSLGVSDSDRLILSSEQTLATLTPTSYNLLGSTQLVSGGTSNLVSDDGSYMRFRSYVSSFSATTPSRAFIPYRSDIGAGTDSSKGSSWDGSSWSAEEELPSSGSDIHYVQSAFSPISTRWNEKIVVTSSNDGYLDAYVWDGNSWLVTNDIGFVGTSAADFQAFDIAYETVSGNAMLVYGISSSDISRDLAYKIWDGSSWSGESYIDDPASNDLQYYWISLASYPLTTGRVNEISLISIDGTGNDVVAFIWDGISWGNYMGLDGSIPRDNEEGVAVEYEQLSGDAMFIWSDNSCDEMESRKWSGSWGSQLSDICINDFPNWMTLKADPTSNMLMATVVDDSNGLTTITWDGSSWSDTEHDTNIDTDSSRPADFAWEPSGGKGLLVWGTLSNQVTEKTFNSPSTWSGISTTTTSGSGTHPWIQLRMNPRDIGGDVKILGVTLESSNELETFVWNGASLDPADFTTLSLAATSTTWESFDLRWNMLGDPSYLSEVEFTGTGALDGGVLDWTVDSSWTTGSVNVTIQLFSYLNNQYADEDDYDKNAYLDYDSHINPDTDQTKNDQMDEAVSDFSDGSTNWKIRIRGEKEFDQFDLKVDLIQYEFEENMLDWAGIFSLDESPSDVATLEITYQAFSQGGSSPIEELFIYNFTSLSWDSITQISTTGLEATAGPITVAGIPTDYIDGSSQIRVSVNGTLTAQTNLYTNYFHVRITPVSGSGTIKVDFFNSGAIDIHLVDLWIMNGTTSILFNSDSSPSFGNTVFPGETYSASFNFDWKEGESYRIRVVSERGGIWSRVISP